MKGSLRAAIYTRVSTAEQRDSTSLDVQLDACQGHVERAGWNEIGHYSDKGVSGFLGGRPALDELIDACRGGEVDVVVVYRLDRFGRNLRHLTATIGEFDDLGIQFVSVSESFDSVGSAGRLQRNILSSVAQFEREQMIERIKAGCRATAQAGWWPGGAVPFGFQLERVGRHWRLIINESEAAVLRKAASLILDDGLAPKEAAPALNTLGLRPRKALKWEYSNLRCHLLNAPISGTWRYARGRGRNAKLRDDVVQVTIPEIISAARHMRLVEILQRTSFGTQNPKYPSYYVLSRGILYCTCGRICTGQTHQSNGRRTYQCAGAKDSDGERCRTPRIFADDIEAAVLSTVAAVLSAAAADNSTAAPDGTRERIELLGERITEAEVSVGRVAIALLGLDLSGQATTSIMSDLTTGLHALRDEKDRLSSVLVTLSQDPARTRRLKQIAEYAGRGRLLEMTPEHQRSALDMLDVHVHVIAWHECDYCGGRRRVAGHGRGLNCPRCHGIGHMPHIEISGIWLTGI